MELKGLTIILSSKLQNIIDPTKTKVKRPRGDAFEHWVIIYLEGLSVRHPKGARSIGIGHPRSGDRCTKTLPYPLDPLWVAEQSLQRPRKGVAHTSQSISATP